MKTFWVADLSAQGELLAKQAYTYAALEQIPGCADLIGHFTGCMYRDPDGFDTPLPDTGKQLDLRWRPSAETAGVATLRVGGEVASFSLLATGLHADSDDITMSTLQKHLVRELHDTGYEASFDLMHLAERPLLATINLHSPEDPVLRVVSAIADRCFAAAYFRFHGLA